MRRTRIHKLGVIVIIAVLVVASVPLSNQIRFQRLVLGVQSPMPLTKIVEFDPTALTGVMIGAVLGGFREVGAAMMWAKVDTLWNSGKGTWRDCVQVMRTVTLLDPHWIEPWRVTAWHLAYNMYVETEDAQQRAVLLDKAISALKEGISWNPEEVDLYLELGWTYFDKLDDYEQAARWFRSCLQFEHPSFIDRMIAHAYERIPDIPKALDWYDYCLKRNPSDPIARGATLTIRERYLKAWNLMAAGDYAGAQAAVQRYLDVDPKGDIAIHLRARIYEQAGQLDKALAVWKQAAEYFPLDNLARRKVAELSARLGKPVPPEATYILRQTRPEQMAPVAPTDKMKQ